MKRDLLFIIFLIFLICIGYSQSNNSGTIKIDKNAVDSIFTGDTIITMKMLIYYPNNFNPDSEKKIKTFYSTDSTCTVDEAIWRIITYYYEDHFFNIASSIDMYNIVAASRDGNERRLPHIDVLQRISDYRATRKTTNKTKK